MLFKHKEKNSLNESKGITFIENKSILVCLPVFWKGTNSNFRKLVPFRKLTEGIALLLRKLLKTDILFIIW
jgi:hypothetical protein